jgi:hypothetical protein
MTKAENRVAAKAWHAGREAERRAMARTDAAKADLAELDRLRRYLIFNLRSSVDRQALIDAIDDFAEKVTPDREFREHVLAPNVPLAP